MSGCNVLQVRPEFDWRLRRLPGFSLSADNKEDMFVALLLPIRTQRLILRDFVQSDLDAVHSYSTDPKILPFHKISPANKDDTQAFLSEVIASQSEEPRKRFELAITLASSGKLVGGGGVYVSQRYESTAAIGYVICSEHWRKGFATEAASMFLDMAFAGLGLHRVFSWADAENAASIRVLEKIGMRREGYMLQDRFHRGEWRDTCYYGMLSDEWQKLRSEEV